MTMTTDDLIAMERAATPRPWYAARECVHSFGPGHYDPMLFHSGASSEDTERAHENARLTAATRNILPELLALAKAAEEDDARKDGYYVALAKRAYLAKLATFGEAS